MIENFLVEDPFKEDLSMGRGDAKARVRKRRMEQQGISGVSGDLPLPIVCGRNASENLQIVNFFIKKGWCWLNLL